MRLRIGTRGSPLAMAQTERFIRLLKSYNTELEAEIIVIKTTGDLRQGSDATAAGGDKQDWIRGLDTALINKSIDCAVHSGKDVPVDIHPATQVQPVGPRATPYDIFIPQAGLSSEVESLPKGALIGTSSLRRRAQLQNYRQDLRVQAHRGNVGTRLEKLYANKELSGIILAAAGLERLQLQGVNYKIICKDIMMPAVCQGIVFVQYLNNNTDFKLLIDKIIEPTVMAAFVAERETLRILKADCHSAVGIFAEPSDNNLTLYACVLADDGSLKIKAKASGALSQPKEIAQQVAGELIQLGAAQILSDSTVNQSGWKKI